MTKQALKAKQQIIYVQTLYPQDVIDNRREQEYSPWYIGHTDQSKLTQTEIDNLRTKFLRQERNVDSGDFMDLFLNFLEERGYVSFHSGPEPHVTVDRDENE